MQEHNLTVIDQNPAEIVIGGRDAAKELTKIVSSREKKLIMGGKQYLFFEDWQTIAKFYGVTAKIVHTEELREESKLIGFLAKAVAIVQGVEISGADAECTFDEPNWGNKPRFQLRSMSQTRACAKVLRNCLGWVAVLGGYEPTPAEEMTGDETQQDKTHYWCELHQTNFFKKGKMKAYAHPIEGTDPVEWCHEHKDTKPTSTKKAEPVTDDTSPEPTDLESQRDDLYQYIAGKKGWTSTKTVRTWLMGVCKIPEEKIDTDPQGTLKEVMELQGWSD